MRKLTLVLATGLLAITPFMALAHDGGALGVKAEDNDGVHVNVNGLFNGMHRGDNDNDGDENGQNNHHLAGTVTAVSATGFTLTEADGSSFTVNTASAKITEAFMGSITLGNVMVNDKASVEGSVNGSVVNADRVVITAPNTHKALGKGTVTSVGTNSFTVQQNNHGIVSSFTVDTNASTTVVNKNGTTTMASILVGSKVLVKGLWDEILNVLKAITVRIK